MTVPNRRLGRWIMLADAAHGLGAFALVWAALCILASALVTDTLLRKGSSDRS